jgi:DNA-binding NtrC family response regulator
MYVFECAVGTTFLPERPYVLVVDDEESSCRPLAELVQFAGHKSIAVQSAAHALACCRRRRPEILVTDLVMPGRDGRDLAVRVRKRFPGLPIVLVTGQNLEHPDWSVPCGLFEAIFTKPLDFDRFITLVGRMMPA